jgi:hypothetical protein
MASADRYLREDWRRLRGRADREKEAKQDQAGSSQLSLGDLARWADLIAPTSETSKYKYKHHAYVWRWITAIKGSGHLHFHRSRRFARRAARRTCFWCGSRRCR